MLRNQVSPRSIPLEWQDLEGQFAKPLRIIRNLELWRLFQAWNKRHTFALNRLISWYRQGADVQRLLPCLSTYLGHVDVTATQRYLTMTPELLHEASLRFRRYALEGG